jgi:hypothetical protein
VSACIGKVVTVISAVGSDDLVITQTTTALSESLSVEVERVRTVMTSEKADGVVISERTATSVITKEAEHTIAAERSERIRKLGLVDRPVINRPALAKRLRLGGRVILSKDEGALLADLAEGKNRPAHRPQNVDTAARNDSIAEMYLWLEASKRMQKGELARVVARHWDVNPDYVRKLVRELNPQRRKQIENDMRERGPLKLLERK